MLNYIKKNISLKAQNFILCFGFLLLLGCSEQKSNNVISVSENLNIDYRYKLAKAKFFINSMLISKEIEQIRTFYLKSRLAFKEVEPYMSFVEKEMYLSLNRANLFKVEAEDLTNIRKGNPSSYQVLEELLYADSLNIKLIEKNAKSIFNRLRVIQHNTNFNFQKHHIIWLIKDQISRSAFLGTTGYDSPVLVNSLKETSETYTTLIDILKHSKNYFSDNSLYDKVLEEFILTTTFLDSDFESFDRYKFLKERINNQIVLLNKIQDDWKVDFPFEMVYSNNFNSFFSKEAFNVKYFDSHYSEKYSNEQTIKLGKLLFNDKRLSVDNSISCATCHDKDLAFTDGKKTFTNQTRNTPTIKYSGFQKGFFYDSRASSLEGQIVSVVNNSNEFHTDLQNLENIVKTDPVYANLFKDTYGKITQFNIRHAISNYTRSLSPFNSKFDNNINGLENTLTQSEINGFNLFMGKAACATCHFAPLFNGTVPPLYKESEMELIGVPETKAEKEISKDLGRYHYFNIEERKHFFKTPTIRNIAKTAPYMHNGVYDTLEEVISFYNRGGGNGIGYKEELEYQTLPSDSLGLSEQEVNDLIAFMNTLTDQ